MPRKLIPFRFTPASWGLKGKSYQKAEAEYYLEGEELDKKLIEIEYDSFNENEKNLQLLKIDYKYSNLSKYDFEKKSLELLYDNKELNTKLLDLDLKYGYLNEREHQKKINSLNNEPWVGVINSDYDSNSKTDGFYFELDWNDNFINMLKEHNYTGNSDYEIVEKWFKDVCINTALENDDGFFENLLTNNY